MLLKKANTITTPTAYSNGFLHSVKPVKTYSEDLVNGVNNSSINPSGIYTDILTDITNSAVGTRFEITYTITGSSGSIQLWNWTNYSVVYAQSFEDGTHTEIIETTTAFNNFDLRFYSSLGS